MLSDKQIRRLKWHSRRGMIELDVLLEPFAEHKLIQLEEQDQLAYSKLLECEDPDLFNWFMGPDRPEDSDLARIIDIVLEHTKYKAMTA